MNILFKFKSIFFTFFSYFKFLKFFLYKLTDIYKDLNPHKE